MIDIEKTIVTVLAHKDINKKKMYVHSVHSEKHLLRHATVAPDFTVGETDNNSTRGAVIEQKISNDNLKSIHKTYLTVKLDETIKYSKGEVRERPKAEYKPNLILRAKEIVYKTAKDTIKYVFAGGDTVQPMLYNHKKHNIYSIVFDKSVDDGYAYVVEEVRTGKKHLALTTMYKRKRTSTATKTKSYSLDSYVLNDTLSNQSVIDNPKPRNSLYTVEAVDTNEKSSAVNWAATEIEKEIQGLERLPSTEDVNILAKNCR